MTESSRWPNDDAEDVAEFVDRLRDEWDRSKPMAEDRPTVNELRKAAHERHECLLPDGNTELCVIDALADRLDQETEEVKKANAGFARLGGRLAGVYADLKCEMSKRTKAEREVERLRQHGHHGCDECARNRAALKEPK